MNITIDYDGTFTDTAIQSIGIRLAKNHNVSILTSRFDELHKHNYRANPTNQDIWEQVDIFEWIKGVYFTNNVNKAQYLLNSNVNIHIDNDIDEVKNINTYQRAGILNTIAIFYQDNAEEIFNIIKNIK